VAWGLSAESVRARARLCLAQAITALVGSELDAIEPHLVDAERAFTVSGDEPHEPSVGRALSVLANVPASIAFLRAELARLRGDADRAVVFDQQALTHLREGDWLLRSLVAWNLAVADWLRGRLEPAEHALAEVVAERHTAGEGYLAMRVCYDLGQVQRAQGRLDAAGGTYRRGLEPADEAGAQVPAAGIHVGLAEVLTSRTSWPRALIMRPRPSRCAGSSPSRSRWPPGLPSWPGSAAQGDADGALDAMGQAERIELSPEVVAMLNPVPAWRAGLLLARGELAEAARWANERGLGVTDEPSYPKEGEYLVLARVLLAEQEPNRALELVERLHAQAVTEEPAASSSWVRCERSRSRPRATTPRR
jgi:LuxR family maltose regulon positive regulatory protein